MKQLFILLAFLPLFGVAQRYELKFKKMVTMRSEDVREPLSEKRLSDVVISIDTQQGLLTIKEKDKETQVKIKSSVITEEDVLNLDFEHETYLKGFLTKINGKYSLVLTVKDFKYFYYV